MWFETVFWLLLIPLLFVLLIVYLVGGKKFYRSAYVVSIFTYCMGVLYVIDAFGMSKNGILVMLTISAILLIGVGYYLQQS